MGRDLFFFDTTVIADGLLGLPSSRTGVYRYAHCLLQSMAAVCSEFPSEKLIPWLPSGERPNRLALRAELLDNQLPHDVDFCGPYLPQICVNSINHLFGRRITSAIERRIQFVVFWQKLNRLLLSTHADCIYFTPHALTPVLSNFRRLKRVICIHDLIPVLFPEYCHDWSIRFYSELRLQLPDADGIICVSEATRDDLLRWLPALSSKPIAVIPHAADACFSCETNSDESFILSEFSLSRHLYILSVGTLEPRKNLGTLLVAYSKLAFRLGEAAPRLVLCGPTGWGDLALMEKIKNLQLEGKIVFTGFVSNQCLATLYRNATCFVFPSVCEGFGLPVLEAITSGTPVLSSNHSAMVEVLGDAALFFNPFNSNQLSIQLERIILDQELRQNLRLLGLARAQQFSWKISARRTINFARSLRKLAR
jgi:glycosyltransferase involved in cell wall biosynthesis